jgi:hypothetical protein
MGFVLFISQGILAQEPSDQIIVLSGTLEVEVQNYKRKFDDSEMKQEKENDSALATVEIGIDAELNPSVQGHVLLLWEEGETENINDFMDEGTITIANPDRCPYSLTAGKMYLPFGSFESNFISDPMTLELGEINDTAVHIGYQKDSVDISLGVFNGDVNRTGKDNEIDSYFANMSMTYAYGSYTTAFGISYISNLADTDGLEGAIDPDAEELERPSFIDGMGIFMKVDMNAWFLSAEYLGAIDDFVKGYFIDSAINSSGSIRPNTYNVEFGWQTRKKALMSLKYEKSKDMEINENFNLPEKRYGVCLSYELYEDVSLSFEYLHEKYEREYLHANDEIPNRGKNEIITAQLAISF